jgi:hypothetical protein
LPSLPLVDAPLGDRPFGHEPSLGRVRDGLLVGSGSLRVTLRHVLRLPLLATGAPVGNLDKSLTVGNDLLARLDVGR